MPMVVTCFFVSEAKTPAKRAGTRQVEVRRLDQLLTEAGIERVDFLNIDVEGYDLAVLESRDARLLQVCQLFL